MLQRGYQIPDSGLNVRRVKIRQNIRNRAFGWTIHRTFDAENTWALWPSDITAPRPFSVRFQVGCLLSPSELTANLHLGTSMEYPIYWSFQTNICRLIGSIEERSQISAEICRYNLTNAARRPFLSQVRPFMHESIDGKVLSEDKWIFFLHFCLHEFYNQTPTIRYLLLGNGYSTRSKYLFGQPGDV